MSKESARVFAWAGLTLAALAALVAWIGVDVIRQYQERLLYDVADHLRLVVLSMTLALATGIPAGIALSRPCMRRWADRLMQVFNVGNTVPSLAVLALALAVLGIGERPAILALWLASLLPIVRNTYEGLRNVSPTLLEAARGIGMTPVQRLVRVELPNALPVMLAGIRIALVINVGTVPLSFLIGANSLGELIFPGIYLNNQPLLLLGAAATALLALALDALFAAAGQLYLRRRGLAR
ncbi:choline transport system permease protein OpuBB [Cupriavidus necator N-1]|jgi:osmoprotectant transport system permease protein|uniref:Choline transport system permease protein OpuBB n=1 Tax=Cupriavidus necator (strain ATCC 43291 / DSM 13513 / CCUG 52238 / LMG 8453 / N-1) TaxID=1042878 RepID=G0EYY7_CUPNN|nr:MULTISPECIES: ABC transporter permease [Cupriavidus]AEI76252.1 choline transport system permease protein OpuBB [Cupriavidus necator N-1]KAI3609953.1 Osmoprotectant ABC transporter, permease protein OsmY [Cupriavidus necator H850]MDX6011624.1 ABC transporter permease [Cupriavidus necator]QUN29253.1 ABC transporter permease [Cupriavidus sp. KK10]